MNKESDAGEINYSENGNVTVFLVWLLFGGAAQGLACSCANYGQVKACEIYPTGQVIFRGRVLDTNVTPGARGEASLYRFRVLESFKGIPAGVEQVFIDPASYSSCSTTFDAKEEYLIYTSVWGQAWAGETVLQNARGFGKPFPAAWQGLENIPVYLVSMCSPTKTVRPGDEDLAYLRAAVLQPRTRGWVEGRAVQNGEWPSMAAEFMSATDAVFELTGPLGEQRTARVGQDGRYRMDGLAAGTYTIRARSPQLGRGSIRETELQIHGGGCAVRDASFASRAIISGQVLDVTGKPAADVRVELGQRGKDGKVRVLPLTWAQTDAAGRFLVPNVPVGPVVLAANLDGTPTREMPFHTVYAHGVQELAKARVFQLKPGEQLDGIVIQLPPPLPFGDLYVDVLWPDGSAAVGGARAIAWRGQGRAAFENATGKSNRVRLPLALGLVYKVEVDWFRMTPNGSDFVTSESITVDFRRSGQVVAVRLKQPRPK